MIEIAHVKRFILQKRKTISHGSLKAFRMHVKGKIIYIGDLSDVGQKMQK